MLRSDIRTRARDYLYETTADIWSDDRLDRCWEEEVRSLPSKSVYLEYIWEFDSVVDDQDYDFLTGIVKVEKLERNDGTTSKPDWVKINGWDSYNNILYLPSRPTQADSYRAFTKKKFTVTANDTVAIDVPDEKTELVVWGMVIRAYKMLIGYLRGSQSWDSATKPGDLSIPVIQNWLRDAKEEYKDLLRQYATSPRPRDIDLVS